MLTVSWAGGVFGLLFDSLLGATLERRGWLNNDAVNFLSTASAALCAMALLAMQAHFGGDRAWAIEPQEERMGRRAAS